jgi:hypothetical protein
LIALVALVLYSRYRHPIWIDEFLHFAFAGIPNTATAWHAIRRSILGVNFNQTGIYMLVDYGLLKLFGASALALRLPSLAATVWLLVSTAVLFKVRRFSNFWVLVVIAAVTAQTPLMNFAGEARPYMPLAAAVVGTLALYAAPVAQRRGWLLMLGATSIELGALMHPYFPGYWAAMMCIGLTASWSDGGRLDFSTVFRNSCPWLVALGLTTYGIVGALTWMRGAPSLEFDPFRWIPRERIVAQLLDFSHLYFIFPFGRDANALAFGPRRLVLYAMIIFALISLVAPAGLRRRWCAMLAPLLLGLGALAISVALCWISYEHRYWILDRQWIASIALMPIAVIWSMAEFARNLDAGGWPLGRLPATCCAIMVILSLTHETPRQFKVFVGDARSPFAVAGLNSASPVPSDNDGWVRLANANIAAGGQVWPVFAKFYGE